MDETAMDETAEMRRVLDMHLALIEQMAETLGQMLAQIERQRVQIQALKRRR